MLINLNLTCVITLLRLLGQRNLARRVNLILNNNKSELFFLALKYLVPASEHDLPHSGASIHRSRLPALSHVMVKQTCRLSILVLL